MCQGARILFEPTRGLGFRLPVAVKRCSWLRAYQQGINVLCNNTESVATLRGNDVVVGKVQQKVRLRGMVRSHILHCEIQLTAHALALALTRKVLYKSLFRLIFLKGFLQTIVFATMATYADEKRN